MPLQTLHAGAQMYNLSPAEVRAELEDFHRRQRAEAVNIKRMEVVGPVQPPALTFFISNTTPGLAMGTPDEGYVWSLKLVAVNLATAGTLAVYKASSSGITTRPLASFQTPTANLPYVATWSSDQAELKHGEGVYLVASTNITGIYITGEQVTAEKAAQIYD